VCSVRADDYDEHGSASEADDGDTEEENGSDNEFEDSSSSDMDDDDDGDVRPKSRTGTRASRAKPTDDGVSSEPQGTPVPTPQKRKKESRFKTLDKDRLQKGTSGLSPARGRRAMTAWLLRAEWESVPHVETTITTNGKMFTHKELHALWPDLAETSLVRRELCRRFEAGELLLLPPPQRAWGPYRTRIRELVNPALDHKDSCCVRWRKPPKAKRGQPETGTAVSPSPDPLMPGPAPGSSSMDHIVIHKNTHDGTDPGPGAHQGGSVAETSPDACKRFFSLKDWCRVCVMVCAAAESWTP